MGHLNCDTSLNDSALERWATCCMTGSSLTISVLVFSALLQKPYRGRLLQHCPSKAS